MFTYIKQATVGEDTNFDSFDAEALRCHAHVRKLRGCANNRPKYLGDDNNRPNLVFELSCAKPSTPPYVFLSKTGNNGRGF